ncbi:hypothetical protein BC937DRAFT_93595 [Endogone sp. FLAS-F59071]|nr:hypothetical protein BC937DRAFT_93595 [Endogone sp. FLAS-F59071]|eukprot:RUS21115.1 hypothetical protein BC937DRAFT_93595 [Endogone sp. FLAS-F59071]
MFNEDEDLMHDEFTDVPEFVIDDGELPAPPPMNLVPKRRISTSQDIADELRDVLGDGYDEDAEELPPVKKTNLIVGAARTEAYCTLLSPQTNYQQTEASVQSRVNTTSSSLPTTTAIQKAELLSFIRQKESLIESLREQLRTQEEELRLLKHNWNRILQEEKAAGLGQTRVEQPTVLPPLAVQRTPSMFSASSTGSSASQLPVTHAEEVLANAGKAVVENLGRGFASLMSGTQRILESEKYVYWSTGMFQQTKAKAVEFSKEAIVNVREGIVAVAESETFQQTRNKALELSKDAIVNVREGITAVTESETYAIQLYIIIIRWHLHMERPSSEYFSTHATFLASKPVGSALCKPSSLQCT